jgi:vacuolar-type H+-ATPase subunit I/STV1
MKQHKEVIELIQEEPGSLTVDQILGSIPKSKQSAQEFIIKLTEHLKNELLEERALDSKRKKVVELLKKTEPMKALMQLKKQIKTKKRNNEKLMLILLGSRKMAKAMGIDLSTIKALTNGE